MSFHRIFTVVRFALLLIPIVTVLVGYTVLMKLDQVRRSNSELVNQGLEPEFGIFIVESKTLMFDPFMFYDPPTGTVFLIRTSPARGGVAMIVLGFIAAISLLIPEIRSMSGKWHRAEQLCPQ